MTLAGGTLKIDNSVSGYNATTPVSIGALTLTLSTGTSIIDFGNGGRTSADNIFWFSSLSIGSGDTLTINNWSGSLTGGGADQLRFTSNPTANLSLINFTGYDSSQLQVISYGSYYEIVAVPEPGTVLGGLALVSLIGYRERRRLGALLVF